MDASPECNAQVTAPSSTERDVPNSTPKTSKSIADQILEIRQRVTEKGGGNLIKSSPNVKPAPAESTKQPDSFDLSAKSSGQLKSIDINRKRADQPTASSWPTDPRPKPSKTDPRSTPYESDPRSIPSNHRPQPLGRLPQRMPPPPPFHRLHQHNRSFASGPVMNPPFRFPRPPRQYFRDERPPDHHEPYVTDDVRDSKMRPQTSGERPIKRPRGDAPVRPRIIGPGGEPPARPRIIGPGGEPPDMMGPRGEPPARPRIIGPGGEPPLRPRMIRPQSQPLKRMEPCRTEPPRSPVQSETRTEAAGSTEIREEVMEDDFVPAAAAAFPLHPSRKPAAPSKAHSPGPPKGNSPGPPFPGPPRKCVRLNHSDHQVRPVRAVPPHHTAVPPRHTATDWQPRPVRRRVPSSDLGTPPPPRVPGAVHRPPRPTLRPQTDYDDWPPEEHPPPRRMVRKVVRYRAPPPGHGPPLPASHGPRLVRVRRPLENHHGEVVPGPRMRKVRVRVPISREGVPVPRGRDPVPRGPRVPVPRGVRPQRFPVRLPRPRAPTRMVHREEMYYEEEEEEEEYLEDEYEEVSHRPAFLPSQNGKPVIRRASYPTLEDSKRPAFLTPELSHQPTEDTPPSSTPDRGTKYVAPDLPASATPPVVPAYRQQENQSKSPKLSDIADIMKSIKRSNSEGSGGGEAPAAAKPGPSNGFSNMFSRTAESYKNNFLEDTVASTSEAESGFSAPLYGGREVIPITGELEVDLFDPRLNHDHMTFLANYLCKGMLTTQTILKIVPNRQRAEPEVMKRNNKSLCVRFRTLPPEEPGKLHCKECKLVNMPFDLYTLHLESDRHVIISNARNLPFDQYRFEMIWCELCRDYFMLTFQGVTIVGHSQTPKHIRASVIFEIMMYPFIPVHNHVKMNRVIVNKFLCRLSDLKTTKLKMPEPRLSKYNTAIGKANGAFESYKVNYGILKQRGLIIECNAQVTAPSSTERDVPNSTPKTSKSIADQILEIRQRVTEKGGGNLIKTSSSVKPAPAESTKQPDSFDLSAKSSGQLKSIDINRKLADQPTASSWPTDPRPKPSKTDPRSIPYESDPRSIPSNHRPRPQPLGRLPQGMPPPPPFHQLHSNRSFASGPVMNPPFRFPRPPRQYFRDERPPDHHEPYIEEDVRDSIPRPQKPGERPIKRPRGEPPVRPEKVQPRGEPPARPRIIGPGREPPGMRGPRGEPPVRPRMIRPHSHPSHHMEPPRTERPRSPVQFETRTESQPKQAETPDKQAETSSNDSKNDQKEAAGTTDIREIVMEDDFAPAAAAFPLHPSRKPAAPSKAHSPGLPKAQSPGPPKGHSPGPPRKCVRLNHSDHQVRPVRAVPPHHSAVPPHHDPTDWKPRPVRRRVPSSDHGTPPPPPPRVPGVVHRPPRPTTLQPDYDDWPPEDYPPPRRMIRKVVRYRAPPPGHGPPPPAGHGPRLVRVRRPLENHHGEVVPGPRMRKVRIRVPVSRDGVPVPRVGFPVPRSPRVPVPRGVRPQRFPARLPRPRAPTRIVHRDELFYEEEEEEQEEYVEEEYEEVAHRPAFLPSQNGRPVIRRASYPTLDDSKRPAFLTPESPQQPTEVEDNPPSSTPDRGTKYVAPDLPASATPPVVPAYRQQEKQSKSPKLSDIADIMKSIKRSNSEGSGGGEAPAVVKPGPSNGFSNMFSRAAESYKNNFLEDTVASGEAESGFAAPLYGGREVIPITGELEVDLFDPRLNHDHMTFLANYLCKGMLTTQTILKIVPNRQRAEPEVMKRNNKSLCVRFRTLPPEEPGKLHCKECKLVNMPFDLYTLHLESDRHVIIVMLETCHLISIDLR
eukprot:sb/3460645/